MSPIFTLDLGMEATMFGELGLTMLPSLTVNDIVPCV